MCGRLEKKSESSDAFTVEMTQSKVPARGELVIPICFHPMMCQPYEEAVTFSVNNFFTFSLVLTGEVTELNVSQLCLFLDWEYLFYITVALINYIYLTFVLKKYIVIQ